MDLEDIFVRLDQKSLKVFLSNDIINVLKKLDPQSIRPDRLSNLILKHVQKDIMLKELATRKIIINAMTNIEAIELANFLNIKKWEDVHYALINQKFTKKMLIKYLTFFEKEYHDYDSADKDDQEEIEPERLLFPHQLYTVKKTRDVLEKTPHKALLHMPTGSGKTRSAIRIITTYLLEDPSMLVIWLTHNEELSEQAMNEFQTTWKLVGDRKIDTYRFFRSSKLNLLSIEKGFIVASLQKMLSAAKNNNTFLLDIAQTSNMIVIDEAHIAIADRFRIVIEEISRNKNTKLLGLSATPGRKSDQYDQENKELARFFSNNKIMLDTGKQNPITFLTKQGYLSKVTFNNIRHKNGQLSTQDIARIRRGLDIPDLILEELSRDTVRNLLIVEEIIRLAKTHKKIIVFASTVNHARNISLILSARDYRSHYISNKTDIKFRRKILDDYKNTNESMIVCNYGILTMGFDAPKTSAVVIARPTKSYVLYAQMVGRGIRGPEAGGNKICEISTILDEEIDAFISITDIFTQWENAWDE